MMPSLDTFPVPLIHINETNSTNNYLQSLCSEQKVEELTVVVADFQTSGRGQRGNSWESAPGKNLLFSTVIFPEFLEARRQFLISQIISLAIKEELDTYTSDISIKWPNDIYWKEKKICGMLIENDLMGRTSIKVLQASELILIRRYFTVLLLTPFHYYKSQEKSMIYSKY